jgi:hypothetical protein
MLDIGPQLGRRQPGERGVQDGMVAGMLAGCDGFELLERQVFDRDVVLVL